MKTIANLACWRKPHFWFAAERRASAAPLAGVWSVEDDEERQVPGQCACGRPLERQEHWVVGSVWRLRVVGSPAGRSALAG